jgi:hypothetical protein
VGDLSKRLIATLAGGGISAREVLPTVGELLRKAWQPGFVPSGVGLQSEEISVEDAARLRDALFAYYRNERDASARCTALSILAKEGQPELRDSLVSELHDVVRALRVAGRGLFQLLIALEDVGERVFPQEQRSRSLAALERNLGAADQYLEKHGTSVPWQ